MSYRKCFVILFLMCVCTSVIAQTQEGYVKTLGRPNVKGEALSGVSIKIKGEHNPVLSKKDGTFSILYAVKKEGDAYSLQEVLKKGYELNEPDIIGRPFAYSKNVRQTIVMVSSTQLQEDKLRIENNAYRTAEKNYKSQLALLEKQKEDNIIALEDYQKSLTELQDRFEKYQSMIDGLAEHYAHTDYDELNEREREINICIENGELERADSLLSVLFDPIEALKKNKEALDKINQHITDAHQTIDKANEDMAAVLKQQEKDAEHLYQLYTIALSKFDKEEAKFYIVTRAELDTTNVNWQSEAGIFLNNFFDKKQASVYAKRAYRCALSQNGKYNYTTSRCLSNLVNTMNNDDEKFEYVKDAFEILDSIGAYDFTKVRNALYVSLGAMAHSINEDSLALMAFTRATENIEEEYPNSEMLYTIYNNLGMVYRSLKDYDAAMEYHKKALDIALSKYHEGHYKVGWAHERIGETLIFMKKYEEAQSYLQKALSSIQPMYGDSHWKTQEVYLSLGLTSFALHDWKNVYSSLNKLVPELQRNLQDSRNDSAEYKKSLVNSELLLSVMLQAMDSLEITDRKLDYLHQLFDIKTLLSRHDAGMYDVANSLGRYYYEKDDIIKARQYFVAAFNSIKNSRKKNYRHNVICHNLYYTYMDLLSSADSLKYKDEYINEYWPYIDITLEIDNGETPASKQGMRGRYHLLRYEDWNYKSLYSVFDYNQTLSGKPKHITAEKDGIIQSYYFDNRIGSTIEIKYIDPAEKTAIIEKYESLKEKNHEIY